MKEELLLYLASMVSTIASSLGSMAASPAARRAVYESIALAMIVPTYLGRSSMMRMTRSLMRTRRTHWFLESSVLKSSPAPRA